MVLPGLRMQLLAYKELGKLDFEDLAGRFLMELLDPILSY